MGCDHDSEAGLGERQLVGVQDEQLVHHHDRSWLLPLTYSAPHSTPQRQVQDGQTDSTSSYSQVQDGQTDSTSSYSQIQDGQTDSTSDGFSIGNIIQKIYKIKIYIT